MKKNSTLTEHKVFFRKNSTLVRQTFQNKTNFNQPPSNFSYSQLSKFFSLNSLTVFFLFSHTSYSGRPWITSQEKDLQPLETKTSTTVPNTDTEGSRSFSVFWESFLLCEQRKQNSSKKIDVHDELFQRNSMLRKKAAKNGSYELFPWDKKKSVLIINICIENYFDCGKLFQQSRWSHFIATAHKKTNVSCPAIKW